MGRFINSKVILIDSIINVVLLGACIIGVINSVSEEPGAIMEVMIFGCFLGMFVVADIMYWIFRLQKKSGSIVCELARYSIYIKMFGIIFGSIIAAVFLFVN